MAKRLVFRVPSLRLVVGLLGAVAIAGSAAAGSASARDHGPPGAGAGAPAGPVSHAGRWLTDASGRVLLLHGVNMVAKEPPYYPAAFGFGEDDVTWLSEHGIDAVRLGATATGIMPSPGRVDERYLDHLAVTVDQLARRHMYVLLDVHQDGWGPTDPSGAPLGSDGFPQWMTVTNGAPNTHTSFPLYYITNPAIQQAFQSLWDDVPGSDGVGLQEDVAKIFGALARRFGRDPWVLGYDVFNEPWPGTTWAPCVSPPNGCPDLERRGLASLDTKVESAIRRYDHAHLIFIEPYVLFNFGLAPTSVPLPGGDQRSGLSFHMYTAAPAQEEPLLGFARAWSGRTGGALLATEWGALTDPVAITREANEMDGALVPWMYWAFDEGFVRDLRQPPVGDNLDASLIDAIVRPHPLAVAGTPTVFAYDQATRTLDFTWRPGRVGRPGRANGNSAVTSFDVPASVYPEGYTAVVLGGRVTSRPCAPVLTITGAPPVPTAQVHIVPGGGCARGR